MIVAAVSTTVKFISIHFICKREEEEYTRVSEHALNKDFLVKKSSGCCGCGDYDISWYQTVHWFTFVIGNEIAFVVFILYFIILYRGEQIDGINANVHLVNGLVSLVDIWISGIPVNFVHFIYLMTYGALYTIFTGIYYATTRDVIYGPLDYGENLGLAVGICVGVVLLFLPFVHCVVFYLQYKARFWILYYISRHFEKKCDGNSEDELRYIAA